MRSILIDTNAYTAFMRGEAAIVEVITHAPELFLSSTVMGELLAGCGRDLRPVRVKPKTDQSCRSF